MMALSLGNAHPRQMAKTWAPKNDSKAVKAYHKLMRELLSPKNGRRQHPRPR
jgi:hypothetical protein